MEWFHSLSGEAIGGARAGITTLSAKFCAENDLPYCHVNPCAKPGEVHDQIWLAGCQEAQRRHAQWDAQQEADPEYKRGWDAASDEFMERYRRDIGQTAFETCAKSEVRGGAGSYSSGDPESTKRLIAQCNTQATVWLQNCTKEYGETEKSCGFNLVISAACAISSCSVTQSGPLTASNLPALVDASRNNAARFNRDYAGKPFRSDGFFEVSNNIFGTATAWITFSNNGEVSCQLDNMATVSFVADLTKGQPVSVSGTVDHTTLGTLFLHNCLVAPPGSAD
jgi:hypothetical protein